MLGGGNPVSSSNPAGTGTSISYVGNHAYAYSGVITVSDSSFTTLLKFNTSNSYLVAQISVNSDSNSANNVDYRMILNDEIILAAEFDNSRSEPYPSFARPAIILIPPYSKFELKAQNTTSALDWTAQLVAEVYN